MSNNPKEAGRAKVEGKHEGSLRGRGGRTAAPSRPTAEVPLHPTAVLCVDDDAAANDVIRSIVTVDAEVWEARSFSSAVEAINQRPFNLVICDITKAAVQGMDVLSILASLHPSTAVIVTSEPGAGGGWTNDAFAELGAFAGILKPYNYDMLKLAINEALWPTPVMGKGDLGRAVLTSAAIHEPPGDEMARLTDEERVEVRTVAQVLETLLEISLAAQGGTEAQKGVSENE